MFVVISIMFGGIAVGYLLRRVELLQKIGKPISYTIFLLLFLLGITVGSNREMFIIFSLRKGGGHDRKFDYRRLFLPGLSARLEWIDAGIPAE